MSRRPDGWRSTERRRADGAIESEQRAAATRPAVELSALGGRLLGRRYWLEVTRASRSLVRCRETEEGVVLRLLGHGPSLLTLGPAEVAVDGARVSWRCAIRGGLLARHPGGTLTLAQTGFDQAELSVAVEDYFPRLGVLYGLLQRPFHVSVSRRYLLTLIAERTE